MSVNGMVRPCSRPASNESWEGASRQGARHVPDTTPTQQSPENEEPVMT